MFLPTRQQIQAIGSISFAACFFHAGSLESSMIHHNDIARELRNSARYIIQAQGFSNYNLPNKLNSQYQSTLEQAEESLKKMAQQRISGSISRLEFQQVIDNAFAAFVQNLKTIVMNDRLDSKIADYISYEFSRNNLSTNDIPAHLATDYTNAGSRITHRLTQLMRQDGRNYVRLEEIEKATREELSPFFIKLRERASNPWSSVLNDLSTLGNWLNDAASSYQSINNNTTYQKPSTVAANVIQSTQVEQKVREEAARIARQKGINPTSLPSSLVEDYAQRLNRSVNRLYNIMTVYQRDSVYTHELEQAVAQEFATLSLPSYTAPSAPSYATPSYNAPSCSTSSSNTPSCSSSSLPSIDVAADDLCCICQDNYSNGQRIGILNCTHTFHNECIAQWLKTSKTCPVCRATTPHVPQQKAARITTAPVLVPAPAPATNTIVIQEDDECEICLENYTKGQQVGILSCNHKFHKNCIYEWLQTSKTCPKCRATAERVHQQKTVA